MRSQKAIALEEIMRPEHFSSKAARYQKIGQDLYRQKDFETALFYFSKALENKSTASLEMYDNRSAAYTKTGKLDFALADGKAMINRDKSSPLGYLRTGKILVLQGKEEMTKALLEYGLTKVCPKHPQYQLLQGSYQKIISARSSVNATDPMGVLPWEIMQMILDYLPFRNLVMALRISKCWRSAISGCPRLWTQLDFASSSRIIRRSALHQYLRFAKRGTKSLRASSRNFGLEKSLLCIANKSNALAEIEILEGPLIGQSLLEASSHLKQLQKLSVRAEMTPDAVDQILSRCSKIRRAEFYRVGISRIGEQRRSSIVWSGDLSKLEHLTVDTFRPDESRQTAMLDTELRSLIEKIPNIEELRLRNWTVLGGNFGNFSSLTHLRLLDLTGLTNVIFPALPSSVVSLTISRCQFDFDEGASASNLALCDFPNLKILRMQELLDLDDEVLVSFVEKSHGQLEVLDLSFCYKVTGRAILDVLNSGGVRNLEELCLQSCDVDDTTVGRLLTILRSLKRLELSQTRSTSYAVLKMFEGNPNTKLEVLGVRNCDNIGSYGINIAKNRGVKVDYGHCPREKGTKRVWSR